MNEKEYARDGRVEANVWQTLADVGRTKRRAEMKLTWNSRARRKC